MNANVGKTPVMMAMNGGRGAAFAAGPGFGRLGPPPFREAVESRAARRDQGSSRRRRESERQGAGRLDAAAPGGPGAAGATSFARWSPGRRQAGRDQQGQPDAAAAGRKAGAVRRQPRNNNDPDTSQAQAGHARGGDRRSARADEARARTIRRPSAAAGSPDKKKDDKKADEVDGRGAEATMKKAG